MSDRGSAAHEQARRPPPVWRRCVAEFFGTYVVTLIGAGIEIVMSSTPGISTAS